MKYILLIILLSFSVMSTDIPSLVEPTVQASIIDENFLKKELQESVLEFVNDLGQDPDSVYIPFRGEF